VWNGLRPRRGSLVTIKPYNPLELDNLAEDIVRALERSPAFPLADIQPFSGAGIYLIYYTGSLGAYTRVSNDDSLSPRIPIYVGRAKGAGARKGAGCAVGAKLGGELFGRLSQHRASLEQVTNLALDDFRARFLVVDEIWIPLGEQLLLRKYRPLWNVVVDGFGNHDPGRGRYEGRRPLWDELHPGRPWAVRCSPAAKTAEEIVSAVEQHIARVGDAAGLEAPLDVDEEDEGE
jgi:hypothetical protein